MTTPDRFVAGAIDLGEVKARAEARAQASRQPAGSVAPTLTITQENFEHDVVRRSLQVPVIVLVGTSRSEQSEQLRADFTTLATQANLAWIFAYLDADATPELAQMLGVTGLPTVIALADGRPLADFQGGQPLEALQQWTTAVVSAVEGKLVGLSDAAVEGSDDEGAQGAPAQSTPEDPRFEPATEALNNGDFDAAIAVYDSILAQEPANAEAKAARDNARFLARISAAMADGEADPIARADAAPGDVDLALTAADAEIAAGKVEQAFDRLLAVIMKDKERVRTRMVELFALFDAGDPRVADARARMANALSEPCALCGSETASRSTMMDLLDAARYVRRKLITSLVPSGTTGRSWRAREVARRSRIHPRGRTRPQPQ